MPNMERRLGIDFGTSNSSVATIKNGELAVIKVQNGRLTEPSCIFLDAANIMNFVGYTAIKYFQFPEKEDNYHFVPSIKPGLHLPAYDGITLRSKRNGKDRKSLTTHFSTVDMSALVFRDLIRYAKESGDIDLSHSVIGRPVRFSNKENEDQLAEKRLREAAKRLGIENVSFLYEPVAAGLHYQRENQDPSEHIAMIFDFGGGTLDTTCIKVSPKQKLTSQMMDDSVLSTYGVDLGGTDLDESIFHTLVTPYLGSESHWSDKKLPMPYSIYSDLTEWHLINPRKQLDDIENIKSILNLGSTDTRALRRLLKVIQGQHVYGILQSIERAKIRLSEEIETSITYSNDGINLSIPISRAQYEGIVATKIPEINKCIQECLSMAQLQQSDIKKVIKVGGSSKNLFIERYLKRNFSNVIETDIQNSVVSGLAIAANEVFI